MDSSPQALFCPPAGDFPANSKKVDFLKEAVSSLRSAGRFRKLRRLSGAPGPKIDLDGRIVLLLCSNNYLGLATDTRLKQAAQNAIDAYGCGATGSRLISGNLELYEELEAELARFKGTESALVFTSGYQANVGAVSGLVESGDAVFSDELNHASLIDGCRLSRATVHVYRHCDPESLERALASQASARRKLILTESVFSMEGDLAPLQEIVFLARKYGALLLVDEAHATGVFGPSGAGQIEALGLQSSVDIQMGTFSKALGSLGGFLAGSKDLVSYLVHRARSFVFTTGLPPAVLAASTEALRIVQQEPERRQTLWNNVRELRSGLESLGFRMDREQSQILPLQLGEDQLTMAACRFLLKNGVFVQGIRPPTVPAGTARLRISPTALHTEEHLAQALAAFEKLAIALLRRSARSAQQLQSLSASFPRPR